MPNTHQAKPIPQSRKLAYLVVLLFSIPSAGCMWVAAGAAVGGAAASYAYMRGRLYRDFPTDLTTTRELTNKALAELRYPIKGWRDTPNGTEYTTTTPDGYKITIDLERLGHETAKAGYTRVGVRVEWFGDEEISQRILDQISVHVGPPGTTPKPTASPSRIRPVAATTIEPPVVESPAPPLAPVPAVKKK